MQTDRTTRYACFHSIADPCQLDQGYWNRPITAANIFQDNVLLGYKYRVASRTWNHLAIPDIRDSLARPFCRRSYLSISNCPIFNKSELNGARCLGNPLFLYKTDVVIKYQILYMMPFLLKFDSRLTVAR